MTTIGVFDAKTHLTAYLERAHRGEVFEITRRGKPVARIVPAESSSIHASPREAVENLRRLRKAAHLRGLGLRQLIDGGRR